MKFPRFINEYKNFVMKNISHNELMNPGIKAEIIRRINVYYDMIKSGQITIHEYMAVLSRDCMHENEDMEKYMI